MWFPTLSSGHCLVLERWKSLLFVLGDQLGFSSPSCQLLAVSQRTECPGAPRALCAAQTLCTLSRPPRCCPSPGHTVPVAGVWGRMSCWALGSLTVSDDNFWLDWQRILKILAEQREKNGFACAQVKKLGADSQFVLTYSSGTWTLVILYAHCLSRTPLSFKIPLLWRNADYFRPPYQKLFGVGSFSYIPDCWLW